jgi:hypothetical protein
VIGGAVIEGRYRYRLLRSWGEGPRVCFVMLNPSTADAEHDDPTIRRCIGYAKALEAGSLQVVNLFALRATDPSELRRDAEPVGPANDSHIEGAALAAEMVICAWGAHPFARQRSVRVLEVLTTAGVRPMCLRQTKDGHPAHPLYLPASLRPVPLAEAA